MGLSLGGPIRGADDRDTALGRRHRRRMRSADGDRLSKGQHAVMFPHPSSESWRPARKCSRRVRPSSVPRRSSTVRRYRCDVGCFRYAVAGPPRACRPPRARTRRPASHRCRRPRPPWYLGGRRGEDALSGTARMRLDQSVSLANLRLKLIDGRAELTLLHPSQPDGWSTQHALILGAVLLVHGRGVHRSVDAGHRRART